MVITVIQIVGDNAFLSNRRLPLTHMQKLGGQSCSLGNPTVELPPRIHLRKKGLWDLE